MALRVETRQGSSERTVLVGMLTARAVLGPIAARWEPGLFPSRVGNLVAGWCVDHYRRYHRPPGRDVLGYFDAWAATTTDRDTIGAVESLLSAFSDEYTRLRESVSPDYVVDLAAGLFNRHKLAELKDAIEGDLLSGEPVRAEERVAKFRRVELGLGAGIDVLTDEEAMEAAFEARGEPVITYPGALGNFFADALLRDCFISFMGKEKIGKCLTGDTEVMLADGRLARIDELVRTREAARVVSYNRETLRFEAAPISAHHDNGERECLEMRTRTGRQITATPNHPFLTPEGWKEFKDLAPGDYVATVRQAAFFGTFQADEDELKVLSYLMAEGCTGHGTPSFTNTDPVLVADFEEACRRLGFRTRRSGITTYLSGARGYSRRMGLFGHGAKTKTIPEWVFRCSREQVALFLRIFFSCDGHISRGSDLIELGLANKRLLRQISHLLARFGVVHDLQYHPVRQRGRVFKAWRICVRSQRHVDLFLSKINFLSVKCRAPQGATSDKSFLDKLPWQVAAEFYASVREELGGRPTCGAYNTKESFYSTMGRLKAQTVRGAVKAQRPVMKTTFSTVAHTEAGQRYLGAEALWDQIDAIRPAGKHHVYDITVPGNHNFVANDFVAHNSYWLMDMTFRAVEQGRNVAHFEVGDMSQPQVLRRLGVRAAGRPQDAARYERPVLLESPGNDPMPELRTDWHETSTALTPAEASRALRDLGGTNAGRFKLSCHPNSSIGVAGIDTVLEGWERDGWVADVVVVDYADILAPPDGAGRADVRDQINANWKALRALSQRRHCLVVTATQTDADSYTTRLLSRENFSEDKRKYSHVTGMIGLNQLPLEKERGLYRLNWIALRDLEFSEKRVVWCASCLPIANPCVLSTF